MSLTQRRTGSNWRAMIMRTSFEMSDSSLLPMSCTAQFFPRLPPAQPKYISACQSLHDLVTGLLVQKRLQ